MKKMFIIIGLIFLGLPVVFANEIVQDYFDIAQDYFNQGDYQNSSEYIKFILQLEPENTPALELKNKIYIIANPQVEPVANEDSKNEARQEPEILKEPKIEIKQEAKVEEVFKTEIKQEKKDSEFLKPEIKQEIKVIELPKFKQEVVETHEIKSEVKVVEPKKEIKQEVPDSKQTPVVTPKMEEANRVCAPINQEQTAEIVNSLIETPAEIEQFSILELPMANTSDMEYPRYTQFQKKMINILDNLIVKYPNKKSLYYAKLKIYNYKNDEARYDELSEIIIKKFEQVK